MSRAMEKLTQTSSNATVYDKRLQNDEARVADTGHYSNDAMFYNLNIKEELCSCESDDGSCGPHDSATFRPEGFMNIQIKSEIKAEPLENSDVVDQGSVALNLEDSVGVQRMDVDTNRGDLNAHPALRQQAVHHPFMCTICHDNFSYPDVLKAHVSNHELYKCNLCRYVCSSYSAFRTHLESFHKGEHKYICIVCNGDFLLLSEIKEHMREHPGKSPYGCGFCAKQFMQFGRLVGHMRTHPQYVNQHQESSTFECSDCGSSFSDILSLVDHTDSHDARDICECLRCGKQYSCPSDLYRHARGHAKDEPYGCNICGQKEVCLPALYNHFSNHAHLVKKSDSNENMYFVNSTSEVNNVKEVVYSCTICGLKCCDSSVLDAHVNTHRDLDLYKCLDCGHRASLSHLFEQHMMNHRLYKCCLCQTCLPSLYEYGRHLLSHKDVKPTTPEAPCSTQFPGIENTIGTDLRKAANHECPLCIKSFARVSAYNAHMEMHKYGITCKVCGGQFMSQTTIKKHMENVHGEASLNHSAGVLDCTLSDQSHDKTGANAIGTDSLSTNQSQGSVNACTPCENAVTTEQVGNECGKVTYASRQNDIVKSEACLNSTSGNHSSSLYSTVEKYAKYQTKQYKCFRCKLRFPTASAHRIHADTHSKACFYCGKVYHSLATLIVHERAHRGKVPYVCSCCDQTFPTASLHKAHKSAMKRRLKCAICNQKLHIDRSTKLKIISGDFKHLLCDSCSKYGKTDIAPTHQCPLCVKSFARISALNAHVEMHKYGITCKVCGGQFMSQTTIKKHMEMVHGEASSNHSGSVVGRTLSDQSHDKTGENTNGSDSLSINQCQDSVNICTPPEDAGPLNQTGDGCGKVTDISNKTSQSSAAPAPRNQMSPSYLFIEKKDTYQRKLYKCFRCKKRFLTDSAYRIHADTHPKSCSCCGKVYPSLSSLIVHERAHRGKVPHVCLRGDGAFSRAALRKCGEPNIAPNHADDISNTSTEEATEIDDIFILPNTRSEPEDCSTFGSEFPSVASDTPPGNIDLPQMIPDTPEEANSGRVPYACSCCNQTFASALLLKKHKRIFDAAFTCSICRKRRSRKKTRCYLLQNGQQFGCGTCIVPYDDQDMTNTNVCAPSTRQSELCTSGEYYQCGRCVRGFVDLYDLGFHMALHC